MKRSTLITSLLVLTTLLALPNMAWARWDKKQIDTFLGGRDCTIEAFDLNGKTHLYTRQITREIAEGEKESKMKFSTNSYVLQIVGQSWAGGRVGYLLVSHPVHDVTRGTELVFTFEDSASGGNVFVAANSSDIGARETRLSFVRVISPSGADFVVGRRTYNFQCQ